MSRIYQSVTSYLPFGRKAQPTPEPESDKAEVNTPAGEEPRVENGKEEAKDQEPVKDEETAECENNDGDVEDINSELPSNKKTDEVYDPKAQPGYIRWAAGGLVGAASTTVGYGVGGIKWVANTGYNTTSKVVTTTTGVIKKVPQVIKRKDKKE